VKPKPKKRANRAQFANVLSAKPETGNPSQFSDGGPQNPFLGNRDKGAARKAARPPTSGMTGLDQSTGDYFRPPKKVNGKFPEEPDWSVTPARITLSVRMRFDAIRGLTFNRLVSYLEQWNLGFFRMAGILWDQMQKRDYQLAVDVKKRRRSAARHGYEIALQKGIPKGDQEMASAQQSFLQNFYDNVQVTDALDPDQRGGMRLLAYQMLDSVGVYYAAHEIIWQPQDDGSLTAKFIKMPVWWLEGTTGKLRFLQSEFQVYGNDMAPGEWLITTGDGLMEASSICYLFKNLPLKSWLAMLDRLGSGALVGKTPAQFNSPQWNNFVEAMQQFGEEWAGVFSANTSIEMLESKNVAGSVFEPLIDKMEKAITRMWRGVDMATAAAVAGESGASVQADEADIFETDDPLVLEEALHEQVTKFALAWKFGDAPVYARLKFRGPPEQSIKDDLAVDAFLLPLGLLGQESTLARYNRPKPADGETVLQPPVATPPQDTDPDPEPEITNEALRSLRSPIISDNFDAAARLRYAAALQKTMEYPALKVQAFIQILQDDPEHAKAIAPRFLEEWKQVTGNTLMDTATADVLAGIVGTAYVQGATRLGAEVANDNPNHDEKGQFASAPGGAGPSGGKDAVGKEGDWKSLNLPDSEKLPTSGDIPHRTTQEDAMAKVKQTFSKTDPLQRKVTFEERLHDHLQAVEPDRAKWLPMAEATVDKPAEVWEHDHRHYYVARFNKTDGGDLGSMVVAARIHENENNVVSYSPKNPRDLKTIRKGKLIYASY
jgi:hypothetical protein